MTQPQGYVLTQDLPAIPAKRYFTIGEVSQLCGVRSYVLRYWEQEFDQLRPMKRRGNRRQTIKQEDVLHRHVEDQEITQHHRPDISHGPPAKVAPEKQLVPRPELPGIVCIEVGIGGRADMPVVFKMCSAQLAPAKTRIDKQQKSANHAIDPGVARHQRAVHRIMRNDEQADRQPALHGEDGQHKQPVAGSDPKDKHGPHMQCQPTAKYQREQAKANQRLLTGAAKSLLGRSGEGCSAGRHQHDLNEKCCQKLFLHITAKTNC